MDLEDTSVDSAIPGRPGEDIGFEMLSAAHLLLNSTRITDERDLLISTCIEALSAGPASLASLTASVNEIWPGARIDGATMETALSEARELGLVAPLETLTGLDWALAQQGKHEIDATRDWFSNAMDRLARQTEDRARDDFGEISFEVASNWARLLLRIFSDEIARSATAYAGSVLKGAAGTIRPVTLDGARMLKSLESASLPAGTTDFLKGCLLAAIDETDSYGNELVGQIATSCILHAIAAGRGKAAAQAELGSLEGQRILLDTPILVGYLGGESERMRLSSLIVKARGLGLEVVAPTHIFDELHDVLARITQDVLPGLLSALRSGTSSRSFARTVNEQILEIFLDGVEAKAYSSWTDFTESASNLGSELEALGVTRRDHRNKDRANVIWADQELTRELSTSLSGRGPKAIARDAESIELIWRARRRTRRRRERGALWPGGWIVSYDRQINPTYRRLETTDPEPLVLTPAQWATLMAEASPPAEIQDLVLAAASFLRQESMLRIATKYPPAVALTLAKSLSGGYSSTTDDRVAQLSTLSEMLEKTSSGVSVTGERLASELASRRSNRLAAAGREQVDLAKLERVRLAAAITRSATVVTEEHEARVKAETRTRELEDKDALVRRVVIAAVVTTSGVAATVILLILQFWIIGGATIVSTIVFARQGRVWTRDSSAGSSVLLWALVPEVLGVLATFYQIIVGP